MLIDYNWKINNMVVHKESKDENNIIHQVHWTYIASKEHEGVAYYSQKLGCKSFSYDPENSFIPYKNSKAFEDVVIGWLEGALDVPIMAASIEAQIQKEITPVNEDLYFTWQNPPPPPLPKSEQ